MEPKTPSIRTAAEVELTQIIVYRDTPPLRETHPHRAEGQAQLNLLLPRSGPESPAQLLLYAS